MAGLAFASEEWAARFKDEINGSAAYKASARGWKWTIGFVVEAEPDRNVPEPTGLVLDLFDGVARDVKISSAADARNCDFVITASYSRWKQVVKKDLDAIRGMMMGRLKLKGDLTTIVRYTKAAQELTECATRVPTEWQDER